MVRIITDSAADFEPEELQRLQIDCIPLTVTIGDAEYQENVSLSKELFYKLLASTGAFPKTAQASPRTLLELFRSARLAGEEAIYITLSSALSGTYQTALMTKALADDDGCFVVDSRNATGGQRMLVEYAVRLRGEGRTAAEIAAALEKARDNVVLYACMDTMEYLYKGGRVSQAVYKLGTLANIKPIISVDADGKVTVPAKAMGMRKGMDFLCKRTQLQKPDDSFPFYVMYTNNREVARALAKRLEAVGISVGEERIIQVGAAIGAHIGPEACGLVYIGKKNGKL